MYIYVGFHVLFFVLVSFIFVLKLICVFRNTWIFCICCFWFDEKYCYEIASSIIMFDELQKLWIANQFYKIGLYAFVWLLIKNDSTISLLCYESVHCTQTILYEMNQLIIKSALPSLFLQVFNASCIDFFCPTTIFSLRNMLVSSHALSCVRDCSRFTHPRVFRVIPSIHCSLSTSQILVIILLLTVFYYLFHSIVKLALISSIILFYSL